MLGINIKKLFTKKNVLKRDEMLSLRTSSTEKKQKLNVLSLKEDPEEYEKIIVKQQEMYEQDDQIRLLLDSIFLEKDRAASFERFFNSLEFKAIRKILSIFGVSETRYMCEIGGGPGFLTWALHQLGYRNLDLIEPNKLFNTGTGYLTSRDDIGNIKIYNDLHQWYERAPLYDVILTKNCIHHFPNIALSAVAIRQKMKHNGLWFAFREWFADTPDELHSLMTHHPYCQPYNLYEWPYPASHYVEAIEIAGFQLIAVIPYNYANNCLGTWSEGEVPLEIKTFTDTINHLLNQNPSHTVEKFWDEVKKNKFYNGKTRLYTRPQMMLFKKIDI